jgi:hydroxypyruvate isomerase
MPNFAANLSFLYTEHPMLERFAAAAEDGFRGVEMLFPYALPATTLAAQARAQGLQVVLCNVPPGDWTLGQRGFAAVPGSEALFRDSLLQALDYAVTLQCPALHVLAGLLPAGADRSRAAATYRDNLAWAVEQARPAGVTLMIEPINPRDIPGYFLNHQAEAHAVCAQVCAATGLDNLKVQMDLYHCQIVEGDLARRVEAHIAGIGHMQIAGVPDRHEPDSGEVNYPFLFSLLDRLGYAGWIGCEYRPRNGTRTGLGWLRPWLR